MEQQDKIKQYLCGQLSDEAAQAFRREMAADPGLSDWVRSTKQLMLLDEMAAREKVRGYLGEREQFKRPTLKFILFQRRAAWAAAAAVVLIVMMVIWPKIIFESSAGYHPTPSSPTEVRTIPPSPDTSSGLYTEITDTSKKIKRSVIRPLRVKRSRPVLADSDMEWIRHYHETKRMGFSEEKEDIELKNLWKLIEDKKFEAAILLSDTIKNKTDKVNIMMAYTLTANRQTGKALILLEELLQKEAYMDTNTKNTVRLLAAKCYHHLARSGGKNSPAAEKCKNLLRTLQAEKKDATVYRIMGESFWERTDKLTKNIFK